MNLPFFRFISLLFFDAVLVVRIIFSNIARDCDWFRLRRTPDIWFFPGYQGRIEAVPLTASHKVVSTLNTAARPFCQLHLMNNITDFTFSYRRKWVIVFSFIIKISKVSIILYLFIGHQVISARLTVNAATSKMNADFHHWLLIRLIRMSGWCDYIPFPSFFIIFYKILFHYYIIIIISYCFMTHRNIIGFDMTICLSSFIKLAGYDIDTGIME